MIYYLQKWVGFIILIHGPNQHQDIGWKKLKRRYMKLNNKYIIGTHIMFYEIDMAEEHIQSINNALDLVDNKENIHVDLLFNISEYFEKIDTSKISKEEY